MTPPCSIKGNPCSQVQKSKYSELAGVPVALMGLIGYIAILGSLLAPESEEMRFATVALALGGFGFSMYLTYREVFTLHKICEWCVGSAVLVTIIMCLSIWRFMRGDAPSGGAALCLRSARARRSRRPRADPLSRIAAAKAERALVDPSSGPPSCRATAHAGRRLPQEWALRRLAIPASRKATVSTAGSPRSLVCSS